MRGARRPAPCLTSFHAARFCESCRSPRSRCRSAACSGFFVYPGTSSSSTSTSSSSKDYAYITDSTSGSTFLSGYAVSSGTLVAATSAPYSLGFLPQSVVVSIPNTFVYVASNSQTSPPGAIYGYSIGTGGALTILNSGTALASENSAALEVSPDGNYLFSLNADGLSIEQYSINTTTGALSYFNNYSVYGAADGGAIVPSALKFAPSGNFLTAALGTGGVDVFAYSSFGGLTYTANIGPANTQLGFYAVAIDASNNIYCAGTSTTASPGLQVFSATSLGVPSTSTIATGVTGNGPHAVMLSSTGSYVYVANQADGTISGFATGTGTLTAVASSPFIAPPTVSALGRDNTGDYLLAAGYSATSGLYIYAIGSSGALSASNTVATSTTTSVTSSIAMTH